MAAYIAYEAIADLIGRRAPEHSLPGIILAIVSLIVMPLLSRAKRRVDADLASAAMNDAKQTQSCTYLSANPVRWSAAAFMAPLVFGEPTLLQPSLWFHQRLLGVCAALDDQFPQKRNWHCFHIQFILQNRISSANAKLS